MREKKAVVALGGNALIKKGQRGNIHEQFANARESLSGIVDLIKEGYKIAITHGNGPQAGAELIKNECARKETPPLPLGCIDAETEGWMGYMIEQSLQNRLKREGIKRKVVTIITQVIVNRDDPSLKNPTKFVGPSYKKDDIDDLIDKGWVIKIDKSRGFRRVVSSPKPIEIVEKEAIKYLVDLGIIVIAAGGGGIPVYIEDDGTYEGIDAVIDKDRASAILASDIKAELLVILTDIDAVYINFNKEKAKPIRKMNIERAEEYLKAGEFPSGTMKPKIEAAINFLKAGGKEVIIGSVHQAKSAVDKLSGTLIVP
ncbi:MAG: carbamate kinase [Candidatus Cloacimonadota bacterium]|nr:MAG: carbamate kinase [Candidatus Cloacimonadota bacterium]